MFEETLAEFETQPGVKRATLKRTVFADGLVCYSLGGSVAAKSTSLRLLFPRTSYFGATSQVLIRGEGAAEEQVTAVLLKTLQLSSGDAPARPCIFLSSLPHDFFQPDQLQAFLKNALNKIGFSADRLRGAKNGAHTANMR